MENYNYMMSADDIAKELNCSKSHAYKLVRAMNKELSAGIHYNGWKSSKSFLGA